MRDDCTVLCCSCDKYADLLPAFVKLFRKFWPECPFELVLVTETNPNVDGFDRVIACGGGMNWASRLVKALGQIDTPYVMMLCDDYYLEEWVDNGKIIARLKEMKRLGAANLRLIPNPKVGKMVLDSDLLEYEKNTAYCIATQAGFWEKDFLLKLAGPVESIWEFERYGSYAVGDEKRPLLHTATREFPFVDAVHKGCWEKFGLRVCRENGIDIDFSRRGLPSIGTRVKEFFKALVFALVPNTLIVKVQNRLSIGAKENKNEIVTNEVTILIYTFPAPELEDAAFAKIAASIEKTWEFVGRLKTVIVAARHFRAVDEFVSNHPAVELQIEPSLVPGDIKTMSIDCIKKLYTRFGTKYVLVIQDDGFPIRSGIEEFIGKYDFIGAPIIADGWKRSFAYALGFGSFNGGFSLRSRRLCKYASDAWRWFFSRFMSENSKHLGEDFYYTTLLKLLPTTWFRFRFPNEREAFRFSVDKLGGLVSPPKYADDPFGVHGK